MLLSVKRQFIFIHIYKNAGTSITNALMPFASGRLGRVASGCLRMFNISTPFDPQPFARHSTASEIVELLGEETFHSFFTFAVVRNPWDWQVSLYKYMLKQTKHQQHNFVKSLAGFDEYIRWRCAEEVRFQKDFVCSEDGELLVDFVGRFETIDRDFNAICSRIGISASLPRMNVSGTEPYREYYTEETENLVRQTFEPDVLRFGYDF